MSTPELAQLELLAQVDDLVEQLAQWAARPNEWEPLAQCRSIVRRLLNRVEALRIRLETPLVVATFGGTGTGKSALVNALVGRDCSPTGRQRPTTTRPVLLVHPQTDLPSLNLPLDELDVVPHETPLLRDIVLIDCPDPDTSEAETPGSNLQRLHHLLPHCDVLIYTSTQQKYRSARVGEELAQAARGCRLLFVQTHAALDSDIRDDWRAQLSDEYRVADMFFVDSLQALGEQQAGRRPAGDFGRLLDVLTRELSSSKRVRIRRANLLDLTKDALDHCRMRLDAELPKVRELEQALEQQRSELIDGMSRQLGDELLRSRKLWQRRLVSAVTEMWGTSPFSSVLRVYNGLGGLIASAGLLRARSSAQMALIGALQGARWFSARRESQESDDRLERIASFGFDDARLREAQLVISGYVHAARFDRAAAADLDSLDRLRRAAARVQDEFLGDAGRRINEIIDELALRNSGFLVRGAYELLFLSYVGYVLYRIGKNFFYESFWLDLPILDMNFYVPAAVFLLLWSGLLVMLFTGRLQHGLTRRVRQLAEELAQARVAQGLFPTLEQACRTARQERDRLDALAVRAGEIRAEVMYSSALGTRILDGHLRDEPVSAGREG